MVIGKPFGYLQVWLSISPWDCHEQIQLVTSFQCGADWDSGPLDCKKKNSQRKMSNIVSFNVNCLSHDCDIDIDHVILTAYFFIRR